MTSIRHGHLRAVQLTPSFTGGCVYCAHLFASNLSAAGQCVRGKGQLASHLSHDTQTLCPICQTGIQAGTSIWQRLIWDTKTLPCFPHFPCFTSVADFFLPLDSWGQMQAWWKEFSSFFLYVQCSGSIS